MMMDVDFLAWVEEVAQRHYPATLPDSDLTIRRVGAQQFYRSYADKFSEIEDGSYHDLLAHLDENQAARLRHGLSLRHMEHQIVFDGSDPVAFVAGEMLNEETFHCRYTGVVRSAQLRGLGYAVIRPLMAFLEEVGYARVNGLHGASNIPALRWATALKYSFCGMENNERFGPQVQSLYIFDKNRRDSLHHAFGPIPHGDAVLADAGPWRVRPHDFERLSTCLKRGAFICAYHYGRNGAWLELTCEQTR